MPTERWARVEPGCVLDDLNLALKPHGLLFAPDISTSNRATIGGMIANNSSGARSVLYGKTIDHVLELKTVLSDGSLVAPRAARPSRELEAKCARTDLEGACYRVTRQLAAEHAEEIDRRFPKILRRVGGYNLDEFVPGRRAAPGGLALQPRPPVRRLGGNAGRDGRGQAEAGRAAARQGHARRRVRRTCSKPWRRPRSSCSTARRRSRSWIKYVLDSTRLNPEASRLRDFLQGDPAAILSIELYGDRADDLPPRLAALEDDLRRHGFGYHHLAVTDPAAQARVWKLRTMALGLSMAEKGDAKAISFVEDTAVAPEHLRDYIAEFLAIIARHETKAGVYAHASVGCLHVRPVINLKTEEGVRQVRGDRRGSRRSGAQVRRCALGRARRRPGPQPVPGEDVWSRALPGVPRAEANLRPAQPPEPGQDRRCAAAGDEPALRAGLCDARGGDHVRLHGRWRPAAGRRAVRGRRRLPEEARGDDVPFVPGDPRREGQHPRPRQPAPAGDHRPARL